MEKVIRSRRDFTIGQDQQDTHRLCQADEQAALHLVQIERTMLHVCNKQMQMLVHISWHGVLLVSPLISDHAQVLCRLFDSMCVACDVYV